MGVFFANIHVSLKIFNLATKFDRIVGKKFSRSAAFGLDTALSTSSVDVHTRRILSFVAGFI